MPPSPVAGRAGSARVQRLDLKGIEKAEKHGKRLDWSSMQRRVRSADPLVWPQGEGLNLMELYKRHVEGAFIPSGGDTRMLHNIVQFPTELISEDEPERMLDGARKFMERVYGPDSVVAARIDQDEKGRHVVDCFVVPVYTKTTKHTTKRAVSMSKHLKILAKELGVVDEYNRKQEARRETQRVMKEVLGATNTKPVGEPVKEASLFLQGVALQDALHQFLRDEMGLVGVERGHKKRAVGPDWVSAELLDVQRRNEAVEEREWQVDAAYSDAAEAKRQAEVAKAEAAAAKRQADADRAAAAEAKRVAEALRAAVAESKQLLDADRAAAVKAKAEAEAQKAAAAEARRLAEIEKAATTAAQQQAVQERAAAAADRERARQDAQGAADLRRSQEVAAGQAQAARDAALVEQTKAADARKAAEAQQQDAHKRKQEADAALAAVAAERRHLAETKAAVDLERKSAQAERAKAAEALQLASVETDKAQALRREAESVWKRANGVLAALSLWQDGAIEPTGTREKAGWKWLNGEAQAKWAELVLDGGLKAWEVVTTAAARLRQVVEKAIEKALKPEHLEAAARERVSNVDLVRVVMAGTEEMARREIEKIAQRAPVQKPQQPVEMSPAMVAAIRARQQGR